MKVKQNKIQKALIKWYAKLNSSPVPQAIRESLIMIVPVIMVGAFALVLRSFPVNVYQEFIKNFAGGIVDSFLGCLYQATFGILSLYMAVSLSMSYINKVENMQGNYFGAIVVSLLTFCISSGIFTEGADVVQILGVNGLFVAILSALAATSLYCWLQKKIRIDIRFYTSGAGDIYHHMIKHLIPILLVGVVVALFNLLINLVLGVESFQEVYMLALDRLFKYTGRNFPSALLYVFMVHLLWFFGIHGGNVLDVVGREIFEPALAINMSVLAEGGVPAEILSKSFFDIFVLLGGCGSTLCLLLAVLLFEKKRSMRKLARFSVFPSIFNINELLLFGVPIVFNPIMLVPFFLTPIVNLIISAAAMKLGIVPVVTHSVEWTTPILIGGYYATGSVSGAILQAVNLGVGILIYRPFVMLMDKEHEKNSSAKVKKLIDILCESEAKRVPVRLLELKGDAGITAKLLSDDLENSVLGDRPLMFYQPQFDPEHTCIGAEALLRWNHPVYGMIYPPLIIKLLEEMELLTRAEIEILKTVLEDMDSIKEAYGEDIKISVNVTGTTIQLDEYEEALAKMAEEFPQHIGNIMLEITEQASLQIDTILIERLSRIKKMGYRFAIDDFSMGNTSVKYLKSSIFDMIKLDGSLTRDLLNNERSRGIVKTLVNMAQEFDIQILAEYVETEEQKELLKSLGCYLYQGYLYSPAIPLEKFLNY